MKQIISSLVLILMLTSLFAQQGGNFSIKLSSLDNFSEKKNVALYNDHIEKLDSNKSAEYISMAYKVPKVSLNQDFIAVSVFANYQLLLGTLDISYKVKEGRKWSNWKLAKIDDHGNAIIPTIYASPIYISPSAEEIQFKLSADDESQFNLSRLQFRFYFPGTSPVQESKKKTASNAKSVNCNCPIPAIQFRNDWCPSGNCPKDLTPTPNTISHLVVHHSAGSNTSPNWAATVRAIWDFHVNTRGWDDIGYNYLIDPDGVIYEGRGNDVQAAHFSCMNQGTMGVCLLGDFNTATPTTAVINSLIEIMGWKACDIDEDPRDTTFFNNGAVDLINLCGHRDGNSIPASCTVTECPGDNVYNIMNNIRSEVYNYTQTCTLSPSYSDIVVLNMSAGNIPIIENEATQLIVNFKNIGDDNINENLSISYRIDGSEIGTRTFSALNADQSLSQSITHTFISPGIYEYCAFIDGASNELNTGNNSFCVNLSVEAKQDSVTGIGSIGIPRLKIYPNPSSGMVYAIGEKHYEAFILYNTLGQQLIIQEDFPLDISHLDKGIYYLKFTGVNFNHYKAYALIRN